MQWDFLPDRQAANDDPPDKQHISRSFLIVGLLSGLYRRELASRSRQQEGCACYSSGAAEATSGTLSSSLSPPLPPPSTSLALLGFCWPCCARWLMRGLGCLKLMSIKSTRQPVRLHQSSAAFTTGCEVTDKSGCFECAEVLRAQQPLPAEFRELWTGRLLLREGDGNSAPQQVTSSRLPHCLSHQKICNNFEKRRTPPDCLPNLTVHLALRPSFVEKVKPSFQMFLAACFGASAIPVQGHLLGVGRAPKARVPCDACHCF